MENIAVNVAVEVTPENSLPIEMPVRKRPTWLGKLNRTAAKAMDLIVANGHADRRFKRDYVNGVSTYVCPHCNAGAIVVAKDGRGKSQMDGSALTNQCPGTQNK